MRKGAMATNRTVRRRIAFFGLLVGAGLFLIAVRLAYLMLVQGDALLARAEALWTREVPFEAKRGRILDRNGVVLVDNESAPSVLAVPAQITDPEGTARALAPVLGMAESRLRELLARRQLLVRLAPEGRRLSLDRAAQVERLGLPGIYVAEDYRRVYPYGTLAAHVLGFVGADNQGLLGLEREYDAVLAGRRGAIAFYADARGRRMPGQPTRYVPPEDGHDLVTTLDVRIQEILEREMADAWQTYRPKSIIGLVVDPKTGDVLAMASYPTFDPADYRAYPPEVYNRNQPIWRMYEPGSTFKIITLAAALEEKKVDLDREHFFDPGSIVVAGARIRCWKPGGHGDQTFLQVVENSCNPGFVELGLRLGKETLMRYVRAFGFGAKTGIDLPGEATGLLFSEARMGPVELATTAFGQGVSVTPIQQAMAVSAAINGGTLYTPHLAKKIVDAKTGAVVRTFAPQAKRTVVSEATSREVRRALESVVANGTGSRAYVDGYRVGGKTGTAQKVGPDGRYLAGEYIVSFIGFAPADDPAVVAYVAVDHPEGIQFGGVVAAPIVGRVLEDVLHVLDIPPRSGGLKKSKYVYPEMPPVEVPNFIGMSVDALRRSFYTFSLEIEGTGDVVIDQAPAPGTKLAPGGKVRLYLGPRPDGGRR
ncbi:stage V sporulation protein D [Hydrogenibacillus schlegelii]|nr:stage V sporulation protein D [Hydrogenibacillus schlegelii]